MIAEPPTFDMLSLPLINFYAQLYTTLCVQLMQASIEYIYYNTTA